MWRNVGEWCEDVVRVVHFWFRAKHVWRPRWSTLTMKLLTTPMRQWPTKLFLWELVESRFYKRFLPPKLLRIGISPRSLKPAEICNRVKARFGLQKEYSCKNLGPEVLNLSFQDADIDDNCLRICSNMSNACIHAAFPWSTMVKFTATLSSDYMKTSHNKLSKTKLIQQCWTAACKIVIITIPYNTSLWKKLKCLAPSATKHSES